MSRHFFRKAVVVSPSSMRWLKKALGNTPFKPLLG